MGAGLVCVVVLAWLTALSVYDIRERRLPNRLTLPGAAVILGVAAWSDVACPRSRRRRAVAAVSGRAPAGARGDRRRRRQARDRCGRADRRVRIRRVGSGRAGGAAVDRGVGDRRGHRAPGRPCRTARRCASPAPRRWRWPSFNGRDSRADDVRRARTRGCGCPNRRSTSRLSRLLKSQIGCSLKDCVHSVRLEAAAGLVLSGESFHAAARRCGLRDGSEIRASLATGGQAAAAPRPAPIGRVSATWEDGTRVAMDYSR